MAEYICIAETYQGHKIAVRDFAKTKEEARENLIKIFPQYYISKAMNVREYREYKRKYSIDEMNQGGIKNENSN